MYDICEVVITAADPDWLVDLTRRLVDAGVVACAHLTPTRSIYRSNGEAHDRAEHRAVLHTRRGNVLAVVDHVHRDHPHQAPCVIAVPVIDGDPVHLQWVRQQTRTPH